MQTFQLLTAKTLIPPETTQVPTQVFRVHNQSETKGSEIDQHAKHPSFFNMGNTCYANLILEIFLSPLTRAVTLNISLLKRRTTLPWALRRKLSTNKQVPFQFNTQQDVPEILKVVLDELNGHSTVASNTLAPYFRNSTICDTYDCCNIEEVKIDKFPIPIAKSIFLSLNRLHFSESLTADNKWFWPECNGFMDSARETKTADSWSILIPQLLRYNNFIGTAIKNNMRVNFCLQTLKLPISADKQVCLFK